MQYSTLEKIHRVVNSDKLSIYAVFIAIHDVYKN